MNSPRAWVALFLVSVVVNLAAGTTNDPAEAKLEGRDVARQLCEGRPVESFTNVIGLNVRESKTRRWEIPVDLRTIVTPTNWLALYTTTGTNQDHAASLTVVHSANQPNEYRLADLSRPIGDTNEFSTLTGAQAMISFAGSDFWLADLGLEFLHWPGQTLLRKELRSGQSCYVLESTNSPPVTNGYARVVSWIDMESVQQSDQPGLIHADAYDARGKLLKVFEWKEAEKVNGAWKISEVQMRNAQTGSRTTLKFNFGKP